MSALDPVAVWVDLFDLTDHPPTDEELETFGQAIERAVRANVAAEIRATGSCGNGCKYAPERFALIAEGKQP